MSTILQDATSITTNYQKLMRMSGENTMLWPSSYKECIEHLHAISPKTNNAIQHKMISYVWDALFYKTWLYYRKTYILDTDFFQSLTKAKAVRIYPLVLKTLQFNTFAVDLSGSDIFNGYILCSIDITDDGIYFSFLAKDNMQDNAGHFGVFLSQEEMLCDDKGELYFQLDKDNEENSDIKWYRNPNILNSTVNILKNSIMSGKAINLSSSDYDHLQEEENTYFSFLHELNDDDKWFLLKKGLIQFAYYLCTPEPDITESQDTKQNLRRFKNLNKKSKLDHMEYKYIAGTRIGARIRIGKIATSDIGESVVYTSGTPKCPHVRAAHWTHVWCGPKNDQHLEPRFIEVTFVNYTSGNIDEVCHEVTDKIKQNWEGENLICRALDGLNIEYTRQSPVVIDNHRYKFDVAFKLGNRLCYAEYDGQQHFYPVAIFGGQDNFDRTRSADLVKNQYCYDKGICLLRIPYMDKPKIGNLVRKFVDNPDQLKFTKEQEIAYYNTAVKN